MSAVDSPEYIRDDVAWHALCTHNIVVEYDASGCFRHVSERFAQLAGRTVEALSGQHRSIVAWDVEGDDDPWMIVEQGQQWHGVLKLATSDKSPV